MKHAAMTIFAISNNFTIPDIDDSLGVFRDIGLVGNQ